MSATAACPATGKERLSRADAAGRAHYFRRFRFARVSHFRCKACGAWHTGNDRQAGPRGKGRRR